MKKSGISMKTTMQVAKRMIASSDLRRQTVSQPTHILPITLRAVDAAAGGCPP